MTIKMPAVSLVAVPKRRAQMLELAKEIEQRGFAGIYCPSASDNMSLCTALALTTDRIPIGTAIAPIYWRAPVEYAQTAAFIQEVSQGRFRFGIGVAHGPSHARFGVSVGKPLADTRRFVADLKAAERVGELPPIILASMRQKMIKLAGEIGDGMIFANGARNHMATSLAALPPGKAADPNFSIANMVPTCIDEDEDAAMAVNRRTLTSYAHLPNYRNYWREAGFAEEMDAVEAAIKAGTPEKVPDALSKRWLSEVTLFGSPSKVLDGLAAWYDAGIKTPILVPSSAKGNQAMAFREIFDLFK